MSAGGRRSSVMLNPIPARRRVQAAPGPILGVCSAEFLKSEVQAKGAYHHADGEGSTLIFVCVDISRSSRIGFTA